MGVVHVGAEYFIAHPKYFRNDTIDFIAHDIGLIKTWEFKPNQRDPNSTFLCLPTKDFSFDSRKMAMNTRLTKTCKLDPFLLRTD